MGPSGVLPILAPSNDLERAVGNREILVAGLPASGALTITRHLGEDAISMRPAARGYAIGRSVDSLLVTTPYVEWTWAALTPAEAGLPIIIAAGLADPASDDRREDLAYAAFGIELPSVDYLVAAVWTRDLTAAPGVSLMANEPHVGILQTRRGFSGSTAWYRDGVDLESVVRQLWPDADVYGLHVRFVAVIVPAGDRNARALLGELSLHK
ncbi:MAG: hypothetical protein RIC16_09375 [Rhodospirillales bacterium]